MRYFALFVALLVLISCSANIATPPHEMKEEVLLIELPDWFLNIPQNSGIALGIAPTVCYDSLQTDHLLREYASILAGRSKSSVVVVKLKMKATDTCLTPTLTDFKFQVTSNLDYLKDYYENSQVYCKKELNGMTIGLIGQRGLNLDFQESQIPTNETPSWYTEDAYTTNNNLLVSTAMSSAEDISTAYQNAYENAVYKLIRSVKTDVSSALMSSHEYYEKFVEIDASLIIENIKNSQNSLVLRKFGNAFIYNAYVEVTWQPKYSFQDVKIKDSNE